MSDRVLNEYFEWMIRMARDDHHSEKRSFRKLCRLFHETRFTYILKMDENRANDGISLRDRFAVDFGYDRYFVNSIMGKRSCSVLEMMIALAKRCEEQIMEDPNLGDRTYFWFFKMIESLGLSCMDDSHFDKIISADILDRFLRREYLPNGRGGLFTVSNPKYDMRKEEIWYQMMHYLSENFYENGGMVND